MVPPPPPSNCQSLVLGKRRFNGDSCRKRASGRPYRLAINQSAGKICPSRNTRGESADQEGDVSPYHSARAFVAGERNADPANPDLFHAADPHAVEPGAPAVARPAQMRP